MGVPVQMANEIRIPINVTGEDQAARDLAKVERAADKAGDALEDMGGQAADAGKASGKAGDEFKSAGGEAGHLQREVDKLTNSYKGLVEQLDKTGDDSLRKDIRKERRRLREAQGLLKELVPNVGSAAGAGGQAAGQAGGLAVKSLAEAFRTGSAALQGAAVPAIVGIAALAAPGLGATISAAVLGGVGTGGIIGGIALAARDPRVQAAGKDLATEFADEFSHLGTPFVEPVVDAARELGQASGRWVDKLAPSFDKLSQKVAPFEAGIEGLVDNALPGLVGALDASGAIVDTITSELPELGAAFGDLFQSIADNPEAAQHAMQGLLDTTEDVIETTGWLIDGLSQSYEKAYAFANALGLVDETQIRGKQIHKDTEEGLVGIADAAADAEQELNNLDEAFRRVFSDTQNAREVNLRYEQALHDMRDQLRKGNLSLNEQTEAGRANWETILRLTDAIEAKRESEARGTQGVEIANANYERRLENLRKELIGLGLNKKAIDDYINSLKAVPLKAQTEIFVKGLDEALAKVRELNGRLKLSSGIGAIVGYAAGQAVGHRATGGGVAPNRDYIVGENGPELLRMGSSGGFVHNAGQTRQMLAGSPGGGGIAVHVSTKTSGHEAWDVLMAYTVQHLQFEVRTTAGGNAQDYFGTVAGG